MVTMSLCPWRKAAGVDLVRGIEFNSRLLLPGSSQPRFVHMLVYFPGAEPTAAFHAWLQEQRTERRERNTKLVQALQERGVKITLEEVEARGRSLTGRPHFARLLVEKGYVPNFEEAFRQYLGEEAPSFVERDSKTTEEVIVLALEAGGIPVVAHPIRIGLARAVEHDVLRRFKERRIGAAWKFAIPTILRRYRRYYQTVADELDLLPTGGSDFHGAVKPDIELGTGRAGNVRAPLSFLEGLRNYQAR